MNRQQRLAAFEREKRLLDANGELQNQIARLEHQLSVALEIMNDGMVEQFQEVFQRDIQIPDSDTIKKAEE